uniref:Uncharacterized protein n=1 Tax=Oryza sativa subsp. japonica TaxID=39947 RepID=Q2QV07_ORYSJ|nr:hypothetical protein LOC_Os12g14450 [Oryza sativa Japonica Group]
MATTGKERDTSANAPRREKYAQCVDQARLSLASHPIYTCINGVNLVFNCRQQTLLLRCPSPANLCLPQGSSSPATLEHPPLCCRLRKGVAAPHHTKPVARCIVSTVACRQAFMVTLRAALSMAMHRLQGLFPPQHLDAPPFIPSRHQPSCLMSRVPAIATG